MTLFEKIYWTLFIVNTISYLAAFILDEIIDEKIIVLMMMPFIIQLIGFLGYWIVKLFLWIWGVSIDLFPSLF